MIKKFDEVPVIWTGNDAEAPSILKNAISRSKNPASIGTKIRLTPIPVPTRNINTERLVTDRETIPMHKNPAIMVRLFARKPHRFDLNTTIQAAEIPMTNPTRSSDMLIMPGFSSAPKSLRISTTRN
jgi:hypothetical protein